LRWLHQNALEELSRDAFKKKYGYRKSKTRIWTLVAEGENPENPVSAGAIKKSCDIVDKDLEVGRGRFFTADWSTSKLGKKRRRLR
jgi:hypothetical protein